jgi:hypothetical protein
VILINNTVLSNFALAQAIPLLREFCAGKGRITAQVLAEFEEGVRQGILPITTLKWLRWVRLRGRQERGHILQLCTQLGAGEASCLAIAILRGYDFLSDDMKAHNSHHPHHDWSSHARRSWVVNGPHAKLSLILRSLRWVCSHSVQDEGNGLWLTPVDADRVLRLVERLFPLLTDLPTVYDESVTGCRGVSPAER